METTNPTHPKFVRWALVLGIVIVLNVFFAVVVSLALPAPEYEAFCPNNQVVRSYDDEKSCVDIGGQWTDLPPAEKIATAPIQPKGYCDPQFTCRQAYTDAYDGHTLNAFIMYVVLGVIALVAGILPIGSSIVSSGLSYGGVVTLVIGSVQYWGSADNWIRLVISFVALLALLYIGYKRFKD